MNNINEIGKAIKTKRLEENLTMDYVAGGVGVSRATLSSIENGKGNCTIDTLFKIFSFLGLSFVLDKTSNSDKRTRATRTITKQDKKKNRFIIMCVEMYSKYKKMPDYDIYTIFSNNNLLNYISEDYEDLHGMSTEYLNGFFDSLLGGNV